MTQQVRQSLFWGMIGACLCLASLLTLAAPAVALVATTATATPGRPNLAPPATRTDLTIALPEFAPNVPQPRVGFFDAGQLTLGRKVYTQWCGTCHGDRGQGLELWRSSWSPERRNCAQPGCHGANHPPDGFRIRKTAPPLMGEGTLTTFPTAFTLFAYLRTTMPYQAPGTLSDLEYWAVTAYLADQQGATSGKRVIAQSNGQSVSLPNFRSTGKG